MKKARDSEPQEVLELKREIAVWQRTAACMSSYSKDEESVKETIKKTSTDLLGKLISKTHYATNSGENYGNNLEDLQKRVSETLHAYCFFLIDVSFFFFLVSHKR